eukprot:gene4937-34708_t
MDKTTIELRCGQIVLEQLPRMGGAQLSLDSRQGQLLGGYIMPQATWVRCACNNCECLGDLVTSDPHFRSRVYSLLDWAIHVRPDLDEAEDDVVWGECLRDIRIHWFDASQSLQGCQQDLPLGEALVHYGNKMGGEEAARMHKQVKVMFLPVKKHMEPFWEEGSVTAYDCTTGIHTIFFDQPPLPNGIQEYTVHLKFNFVESVGAPGTTASVAAASQSTASNLSPQEMQGEPRSPQEVQAEPRSPHDMQGEPRSPQEMQAELCAPHDMQGEPRSPQEMQAEPRSPHDMQGEPRSPQEMQAEPRSPHDMQGEPRSPQEVQGEPHSPHQQSKHGHSVDGTQPTKISQSTASNTLHQVQLVHGEPHSPHQSTEISQSTASNVAAGQVNVTGGCADLTGGSGTALVGTSVSLREDLLAGVVGREVDVDEDHPQAGVAGREVGLREGGADLAGGSGTALVGTSVSLREDLLAGVVGREVDVGDNHLQAGVAEREVGVREGDALALVSGIEVDIIEDHPLADVFGREVDVSDEHPQAGVAGRGEVGVREGDALALVSEIEVDISEDHPLADVVGREVDVSEEHPQAGVAGKEFGVIKEDAARVVLCSVQLPEIVPGDPQKPVGGVITVGFIAVCRAIGVSDHLLYSVLNALVDLSELQRAAMYKQLRHELSEFKTGRQLEVDGIVRTLNKTVVAASNSTVQIEL